MTHDWQGMIRDLRAQGLTDWKIAQAIGYESPHARHIEAIMQGAIPRHDIGEALIALHNIMCPKDTSDQHLALRTA